MSSLPLTRFQRRLRLLRQAAAGTSLLTGGLLLGLAFFARQLGIDHDVTWGRGRILSAWAGAGLILLAGLFAAYPWLAVSAARIRQRWVHSGLYQGANGWVMRSAARRSLLSAASWVADRPFIRFWSASPERIAWLTAFILVLSGLWAYVWYPTAGKPAAWENGTNYFDRQAQAFLHGQLALLDRPDPRLLALPNPYDYRLRAGVPVMWDASLYNGQYYLYWGPAPALVATLVRLVSPGWIDDTRLTVLFQALTLVAGAILVVMARRRYFPRLSGWAVAPPLVILGFANPVLYVLNRPSVYEAAIAAGQAFLMLGLLFAWLGVEGHKQQRLYLALSGACWALSAASRADLIPAIGWMGLVVLAVLLSRAPGAGRFSRIAALALPLLVGAAMLAWYNAARFGSILETGHRFQLTGPALPADYRLILSPGYLLPNLYSYLFRPLTWSKLFPFATAAWVKETNWPFFIHLPQAYYYPEPVAGLLMAVPAAWLALLLPAVALARALLLPPHPASPDLITPAHAGWRWFALLLGGAFLAELGTLALFVSVSMRYELDLLPTLALLSGLGAWWAWHLLQTHRGMRFLFGLAVIAMVLATLGIGLFMGFSGYNNHFEAVNPHLYYGLLHIFHP